jgi:type II secretory pathway pseudopilin PulG
MKTPQERRLSLAQEEGYILVAAIFAVAVLTLSLSIALPKIRREIQRDQEVETMHRGQQYIRAIQLYYRRFHTYPASVDALVETNGIRFLRKKYADPLTGKSDWKPVLLGQNKAPTFMGFFGQPLGSPGTASLVGGRRGNGSTSTDDAESNSNDLPGGSSANTGTSTTAQSFGGIGIIGFSPASTRHSLLVYKTMDHYNDWEFVYDPLADGMRGGPIPPQPPPGPPTNTGSPGFNAGSSGANPPDGSSQP